MRKIVLLLTVVVFILFSSCRKKETSDAKINKESEEMLAKANAEIGLPNIDKFQEKKLLKLIYELRDREDLICYAYYQNTMTGELGQFIGKCIGYGIPYSTQFSNPVKFQGVTTDKVADFAGKDWVHAYQLMPQAEPNGLFMPTTLSATWLIMIHPETQDLVPAYIEPEISVFPFPMHDIKE